MPCSLEIIFTNEKNNSEGIKLKKKIVQSFIFPIKAGRPYTYLNSCSPNVACETLDTFSTQSFDAVNVFTLKVTKYFHQTRGKSGNV